MQTVAMQRVFAPKVAASRPGRGSLKVQAYKVGFTPTIALPPPREAHPRSRLPGSPGPAGALQAPACFRSRRPTAEALNCWEAAPRVAAVLSARSVLLPACAPQITLRDVGKNTEKVVECGADEYGERAGVGLASCTWRRRAGVLCSGLQPLGRPALALLALLGSAPLLNQPAAAHVCCSSMGPACSAGRRRLQPH